MICNIFDLVSKRSKPPTNLSILSDFPVLCGSHVIRPYWTRISLITAHENYTGLPWPWNYWALLKSNTGVHRGRVRNYFQYQINGALWSFLVSKHLHSVLLTRTHCLFPWGLKDLATKFSASENVNKLDFRSSFLFPVILHCLMFTCLLCCSLLLHCLC